MFGLVHVLFGCLLGKNLDSISLIIVLAFLSHFLLDLMPHWDGTFNKDKFSKTGKANITKRDFFIHIADMVLAALMLILVYNSFESKRIIFGAIFSLLPDLIKVGYFTPIRKNKWYMQYLKLHAFFQQEVSWIAGLIIQIGIILILLYMIF